MYAEFKFVERVHETTGAVSPCLNKASFAFGIVSCVGMCLVATFQVYLVQPRNVNPLLYSIYLHLSFQKSDIMKAVEILNCFGPH